MGLLWRFMEYSPVYSTFAGVMELAVVVLLCFRRTTTLGAVICLPVMGNVMLMNLCYGVIVKLYAIMIVASAAVLVLYDARRLFDVVVLRRAVPASPLGLPFHSRRLNQARWGIKLVLVGGVILSSVVHMRGRGPALAAEEASPLHGIWEVQSHIVAGRELAHTSEPTRWRRLVKARTAAIRLEDDTLVRCGPKVDDAAGTLELDCEGGKRGVLHWTRDGDHLVIDGSFAGEPIIVRLKRRDAGELPLLRARFRWLWDEE
jgi:hypothetical protein